MNNNNNSSSMTATLLLCGTSTAAYLAYKLYKSTIKTLCCPNCPTSDNPTKQGFSLKQVPKKLDVIIIGSGMGGLSTAALLAKQGKKVLVLEQHDIARGNLHTFTEKGYEFDTGLHYIGGKIGDRTSSVRKQLDYITDGGIEWEPMEEDAYDVAIVEGTEKEEEEEEDSPPSKHVGMPISRKIWMSHARLLLPNNVPVVELVRVLLALVVVRNSNNSNRAVVRGFIERVIIHHVTKTVLLMLLHPEEQDTIVPADPITREDHVNPTLPKQSYVLPRRGRIPPHHLYQN
mmetsp:Transcript_12106/g.19966  ORF Transcript_12106/g.19966 Transcript_12106/m.19966 type:complete len:288 (-) Transcript_12106:44-907(-)